MSTCEPCACLVKKLIQKLDYKVPPSLSSVWVYFGIWKRGLCLTPLFYVSFHLINLHVAMLLMYPKSLKKSTQSQLTVTGPSTSWTFDFANDLLFPLYAAPIRSVQYSISSSNGSALPFSHFAFTDGFTVKIISDTNDVTTNFTVTASVDQSLRL